MIDNYAPGNLFSLTIPGKDKPTKIYGILHRENPVVSYGILIKKDENMNLISSKSGWWLALLDGKIEKININSVFFKIED
tara:strand:- start:108 stop:347 length:240 start_codon:yes stop_codon:yes gene_type:complete